MPHPFVSEAGHEILEDRQFDKLAFQVAAAERGQLRLAALERGGGFDDGRVNLRWQDAQHMYHAARPPTKRDGYSSRRN
jgi:hypothetical protein